VRDLRHLSISLDQTIAHNIDTVSIHSKLDYCNSLFLSLPENQLERLHAVLTSNARAVTNTRKFYHVTAIRKSLQRLKSLNAFTTKFYLIPTNAYFLIFLLTYKIF
jgi:hypothetical protein